MDPFTQRMLERAKSRREKLDNQIMVLEKRAPLQENINKNLNEKNVSTFSKNEDMTDSSRGKPCITSSRKSKLQRLAKLYSGNDENILVDDEEVEEPAEVSCSSDRKPQCKLARLNELASKIKEWEDETVQTKHSSSAPAITAVKPQEDSTKQPSANEKQKIWDSAMIEKLCSQGFSRSESQSKLLYKFENKKEEQKEKPSKEVDCQLPHFGRDEKVSAKSENAVNRNEVLKKAAFFESSTRGEEHNKSIKDPAELPLAERKALFERNRGEALLPNNRFATPGPSLDFSNKKPAQSAPDSRKLVSIEKNGNRSNDIFKKNKIETNYRDEKADVIRPVKKFMEEKRVFKEESIIEKCSTSGGTPVKKAKCEKMEQSVPPPPPPMPTFSQNTSTISLTDKEEKGAEYCEPKSGRLYPSLSNLDITDESELHTSEIESNESKNSNFCLNMTLSDLMEMSKNNPTTPPSDQSFSKTKESQVLSKMDKLLEDALNDLSSSGNEDEGDDMIPSPPKMKKSLSFEYKSGPDNSNALLHTVSFYRKQQQQQNLRPTSENVSDNESSSPDKSEDESVLVKHKIEMLIAEVNKQQTIISQASQALNLCLSTVEFSGSGEQVEGERLLLLASHKRQACLNEIQRLKIENSLRPQGESLLTEKGDVHLSNISVKLKRDAMRAIAAAENLQYFVCLIKCDEHVLATPAVSATKENLKDMVLQFPGQVKLEGLYGNFKISVEVYNLELGKELLPHDIKYHIIAKKEKKLLTPIKSKKSESKLVKPHIQSPAGPNAVRTSNFQMCGYIVFSLREITRTQWLLNKVPYVSPLEGTLSMNIQSQLRLDHEFRGFLTMFDDISGFGAWHRRWCLLSSHFISYWKYPDDEQKKVPIGTIDLRSVVTENVGLVSRDICARLNTFLLETTRPRLSEDKDSLVVSVKGDVTTVRHLLSADSKQEMTAWCQKLNKTLALLRSWKSAHAFQRKRWIQASAKKKINETA